MDDRTLKLALPILMRIEGRVDRIERDLNVIGARLTNMEVMVEGMRWELEQCRESLDRMYATMDRIERRLGLIEV